MKSVSNKDKEAKSAAFEPEKQSELERRLSEAVLDFVVSGATVYALMNEIENNKDENGINEIVKMCSMSYTKYWNENFSKQTKSA